MSYYDYEEAKTRLQEILDGKMEIIKTDGDAIPNDERFTFNNGYYGWVTAIFVDIRESTKLFSDYEKEIVARIIRCFTSEIIEILKGDDNNREIGIRGDCVYAIYTTPYKKDVYKVADYGVWINTYMKMLNKMLKNRQMPILDCGIGIAVDKELVVKAGRKSSGINNLVWIGKAVTGAAHLSSEGSKNGNKTLLFSDLCYDNIIDGFVNSNEEAKSWFRYKSSEKNGKYYTADIIKIDFNKWIDEGMHASD